ncbi:acetyltransferase (GNAT) domain protein [Leptospira weilii serovar Ranarum str. ICFT]|uniref:Acetyltransferase (GNAT) domain protein n=1 Tax=Leptospira weilii serovar Ranarum str. ICFT TaxID=1218598 RepID=N1WHA6_9LEPT|nr:GNAT family N-acetyltransferase [Leptospira weilii]EMY79651.1 acetyltransferase (GNAT) domain protein [Leptospira weilii serovar Ranarum str. ICFT]
MEFEIQLYNKDQIEYDPEIESILKKSYIDADFTDPEIAEKIFAIHEIKKRGKILVALANGTAIGLIIVGTYINPYRQIAEVDEAEMQLLSILPTFRQQGVASSLCRTFEAEAGLLGFRKAVLSTQSTMKAAHKLYEKLGYLRNPSRDWIRNNRRFWVYEKNI